MSRQPYSRVSRWVRFGSAFLIFSLTATVLTICNVFLAPFHRQRLALTGVYCRAVTPVILRIIGLDLDVGIRDRLREEAPAIYVLNHESAMDALILMALWPPLGVGIGKREVLFVPFFGVAYAMAGMLLINRSDRAGAVEALKTLAGVVRAQGLSPVLSPEGTRRSDGALGPFKKGFVHLAIATGLPVVPLVIHGAGLCLPARSFALAPGKVTVEVLPTIATGAWSEDTVDDHVADVRKVFADALGSP